MCDVSMQFNRLKYYYTGSAVAFIAVLLVVVIVVIVYTRKKLLQRKVPDPKGIHFIAWYVVYTELNFVPKLDKHADHMSDHDHGTGMYIYEYPV